MPPAPPRIPLARLSPTVLRLQSVEDISATPAAGPSRPSSQQAYDAADQIEHQILTVTTAPASSATPRFTAQASALSARRALVQTAVNRQVTAITLIQALGGGWDASAPVEIDSAVRADNPR